MAKSKIDTLNAYIANHYYADTYNALKGISDVNEQASDGWRPLEKAAAVGNVHAVELLLKHGAKINQFSNAGLTPLLYAAAQKDMTWSFTGHYETALYLLDHGADMNAQSKGNYGTAVYAGDAPIHVAARANNAALLATLIDRGVSKDQRDRGRWTPLQCACRATAYDAAKLLVERGASVVTERSGFSPLFILVRAGNAKPTANYKALFQLLIGAGAIKDINTQQTAGIYVGDPVGDAPLHLAIKNGDAWTVKYLVEKLDANVNLPGANGLSPLQLACDKGTTEIITTLLDHGALMAHKGPRPKTVLEDAIAKNQTKVAEVLLQQGALLLTPERPPVLLNYDLKGVPVLQAMKKTTLQATKAKNVEKAVVLEANMELVAKNPSWKTQWTYMLEHHTDAVVGKSAGRKPVSAHSSSQNVSSSIEHQSNQPAAIPPQPSSLSAPITSDTSVALIDLGEPEIANSNENTALLSPQFSRLAISSKPLTPEIFRRNIAPDALQVRQNGSEPGLQ